MKDWQGRVPAGWTAPAMALRLEVLAPRFPSESLAGDSSAAVSHSKVVDQLSAHHKGYIPHLSK